MVEFRQGFRSMAAPTRELEKLIVSKKLAHGGNPVTRWMAANVAVAQDPAGIGRRAAYLLFARMAGEAGPPATHHVPTVLIPRGSGELPPPPR